MSDVTRRGAMAATLAVGAAAIAGGTAQAQEKTASSMPAADGMRNKAATRLATKRWLHLTGFATLDDVVNYANLAPAQSAGELVVIPVAGNYDVLVFI